MDMGASIDELTDNGCVCSLVLNDNHKNAVGGVMGGVIFTLADFAFIVAANNRHSVTVSLNASINYLGTAKGKKLIARAECRKDGKNTAIYNVDISDELGNDVAQLTGTGYKLRK